MFKNRGKAPAAPKRGGAKRHLHAVNPANEKDARRKSNPEEPAIPWKTIVVTTMVTSVVSTFAVTFARWLLDRAQIRKLLAAKEQQQQQYALAAQGRIENPGPVAHHSNPALALPQPPHLTEAGSAQFQPIQALPSAFQPNPFAPMSIQRPIPLPEAPHVNYGASAGEPAWFREFREEQERRLSNVEARVRQDEREQERGRFG
jgi:hypothetical protein